ncbi:MAG TPA: MATE family efflux transporter [Puia sp.]|nr:MATE family efflux transporter [Puia sp.]
MTAPKDNHLRVEISNRQILSISLPISLAILVPQINFITNNIFLGHLDEQSLAAAGITGVYYLIFAVIGNGINNGLQALIARRAGENRIGEIGKLFFQGIRIVIVMACIGIVLTYLVAPWILNFSLTSPILKTKAIQFIKIRIWGLPFLYIYQLRNALLVGTNQSKFLVYGTIAEALTNIIFDYSLIFGHFGLPGIGFNGAAYASIIAEATGMLVVFGVIHSQGISRRLNLLSHSKLDKKNLRLILVQSSPLVFQYGISIVSWEFFYILIEHHGQRDLAISNSMRNIFGLFGAFSWAFASTSNTMVSNIIGQGKKDKVVFLIKKIARLSISFCVIISILLNLFPGEFLLIYGQDQLFIERAIPVIRVVTGALILMSFATVWLNAVTGTGNTMVNLGIEAVTILFYCIYIYLILQYWNLPIIYGWMSEWLYWIFTFTLSYLYIRSGKWKMKTI